MHLIRWAIKQERFDNLGQWKHTRAENPEWNRQALSWPITEEGDLNDNYDWPMEGYLLPYAPPLKASGTKKSSKTGTKFLGILPVRIMEILSVARLVLFDNNMAVVNSWIIVIICQSIWDCWKLN